jgi:hypothetical protein
MWVTLSTTVDLNEEELRHTVEVSEERSTCFSPDCSLCRVIGYRLTMGSVPHIRQRLGLPPQPTTSRLKVARGGERKERRSRLGPRRVIRRKR